MIPITALYVPGDRSDRFRKALESGADIVILDLEDSVAPEHKGAALEAVVALLRQAPTGPALQVRVNAGAEQELRMLAGKPIGVRVPKVESPGELDAIASMVPGLPLTAVIESARGVEAALDIARHPAVVAIALGESDLASDLRTQDPFVIDHVRVRLLLAARAAGLPAPMLSVYPDLRDFNGLRADSERGRRLGWLGRGAAHPSQLPVIREVFRPHEDEIAWARAVLAAREPGGVAVLANGEMVDAAMDGRARAILEHASEYSAMDPESDSF